MTKEEILSAVLEVHGVSYEDVVQRSRKQALADIRSQYVYFVNKYIKDKGIQMRWIDVCEYIGYTGHTMYFHALNKALDLIETDSIYRGQVMRINDEIRGKLNLKVK